MKNVNTREQQMLVSLDEAKLIEKYREALEKLKPGQSAVTRAWSFPLIQSSGDAIFCSVAVSWRNLESPSSESQVKIDASRLTKTSI